MAIVQKEKKQKRILDLNGEEGNVFYLMGLAGSVCKLLEKDCLPVLAEMKSGNYENAVYVFNREFGEFFDIILPDGMTEKDLFDAHNKTRSGLSLG